MEKNFPDHPIREDIVDANPLEPYPPLTHDEIHDVSEILKELIEKAREKSKLFTEEEKEALKKKFETERLSMAEMSEEEIIDFIRNCKRGSLNFLKLQENQALALALSDKLIKLTPRV